MSKVKNPLYSLDGRGSIGNVISFAKRRGVNIAESKPIPKDRRTILQMYSRWLYEDYIYLWKQQTDAVQAEYKAQGALRHLSGYQYWMSYQLTYLPDIAGMWHFDELAGSIAHDSSRNHNDGAVFDLTSVKGAIGDAFYGDGIDNYVDCGSSLDLCGFSALTMEYFVFPEGVQGAWTLPLYRQSSYYLGFWSNTLRPLFRYWDADNVPSKLFKNTEEVVQDQLSHLAVTFDGTWVQFFINGIPKDRIVTNKGPLVTSKPYPLYLICFDGWAHQLKGYMDHVVIYNRVCDTAEIKRHSDRRYPLPTP